MARKNPPLDPEAAALIRKRKIEDKEIIQEAVAAIEDTEELLTKLERVQGERGLWTSDNGVHNLEYLALRDAAAVALESGPRYFIDADGAKRVAVRQQSEPVEIDLAILSEIPPEIIDKVAPRRIDAEAFKRNVANGKIPAKAFVKHSRIKYVEPHVRFILADDADD